MQYSWAQYCWTRGAWQKSNPSRFLHCRDDCRETNGWFMSRRKIGADELLNVTNRNGTQPLVPVFARYKVLAMEGAQIAIPTRYRESAKLSQAKPRCRVNINESTFAECQHFASSGTLSGSHDSRARFVFCGVSTGSGGCSRPMVRWRSVCFSLCRK
jgi:hypothetical protein